VLMNSMNPDEEAEASAVFRRCMAKQPPDQ